MNMIGTEKETQMILDPLTQTSYSFTDDSYCTLELLDPTL